MVCVSTVLCQLRPGHARRAITVNCYSKLILTRPQPNFKREFNQKQRETNGRTTTPLESSGDEASGTGGFPPRLAQPGHCLTKGVSTIQFTGPTRAEAGRASVFPVSLFARSSPPPLHRALAAPRICCSRYVLRRMPYQPWRGGLYVAFQLHYVLTVP